MLDHIVVPNHGSDDIYLNVLAGVDTLDQSPTSRVVTRETRVTKARDATAPHRMPRRNCFST